MATISNPNQGFNKKKKNNLNPNNDPNFERNQQLIKSRLDRTKNVSPDMTSADDLLRSGRSPEQQAQLEADRELKRIELEQALLNATPATQGQTGQVKPVQSQGNQLAQTPQAPTAPGQSNIQVSSTNQPNDALNTFPSDPNLLDRAKEVGLRAAALNPLTLGIAPLDEARNRGIEDVKQVLPQIANKIALVADIARTAFSGKSSKQLTSAEEVMGTYMSALAEDVQLYRQGLKSFEDVAQNIRQAESSINTYEANLVGEGRRNLNFWIDEGARIEANVIAQKDKLNDFKSSIINAGVQQV